MFAKIYYFREFFPIISCSHLYVFQFIILTFVILEIWRNKIATYKKRVF